MNTEATEYSRSATDDQAARQEDPAFDPSVTDPDSQRHRAAEESKVRILLRIRNSLRQKKATSIPFFSLFLGGVAVNTVNFGLWIFFRDKAIL